MSLKQRIFNYLQGKQPAREVRFPHFDRPLKILIVYESDQIERNDAVKSIQQDLIYQHMDITLWGYVAKKEKDISSPVLPQSRMLGLEDYNIFGKPKKEVLEDLTKNRYNVLLDLTTQPCLPLRYIAMYAHADFKAGLNLGEGVHDMLISPPNLDTTNAKPEVTWLYNQIMGYLTTIKSND